MRELLDVDNAFLPPIVVHRESSLDFFVYLISLAKVWKSVLEKWRLLGMCITHTPIIIIIIIIITVINLSFVDTDIVTVPIN